MDDRRFDALARLVSMTTRLSTRRTTLIGVAALLAGWLPGRPASAQRRPQVCRPLGGVCFPGREVRCCGAAACRQGKCRCSRKQRACGGRCISKNRCCHHRDCPGHQRCQKGRCQRPGGKEQGQGQCGERKPVDLKTSKQHCGECGLACAGTATCKNGVCVSGGTYREVRRWNTIEQTSQFWFPFGIAVDRAGVLYVIDDVTNEVWRFTANGGTIDHWPGGGSPIGIDVTPGGVVFVSQGATRQIRTFSSNGTPQPLTINTDDFPRGLAVGPSGDIYVAVDTIVPAVQRFDPDGTLSDTWTGFSDPTWPAVASNGDVYVTNQITNEVFRFSATGVPKGNWSGQGDGALDVPYGITVDAAGFVYVVSRNNARVLKFTATGTFVGTIADATDVENPIDIAVSRSGMVYVTDPGSEPEARFIIQFEPA